MQPIHGNVSLILRSSSRETAQGMAGVSWPKIVIAPLVSAHDRVEHAANQLDPTDDETVDLAVPEFTHEVSTLPAIETMLHDGDRAGNRIEVQLGTQPPTAQRPSGVSQGR